MLSPDKQAHDRLVYLLANFIVSFPFAWQPVILPMILVRPLALWTLLATYPARVTCPYCSIVLGVLDCSFRQRLFMHHNTL